MHKIEIGLSEKEFNTKLSDLLGVISNDDYFKLGCDLSEIISENSHIFKFMNIPNDDNTIQRVVVAGTELHEQIVKLLAIETEKIVMVSEPVK
jgi:hypothetical protein